jgi:Tfp pilus assembly protein PilV
VTERDRGVTRIEVVVALSLLGFALVSLLGGLGSTVRLSVAAAEQSLTDTSLQSALSALDAFPYISCATTYNLGTDATVTAISYWNGTAWSPTCTGAQPQRITVTADSRFLDVVKTND